MPGLTAFYDASVLYGSTLRNLLMHLALTGLFRAKWSAGVHEEWMNALLRNRSDLSPEKLERTRMLMDKHAEDALTVNPRRTRNPMLSSGAQGPLSPDRNLKW